LNAASQAASKRQTKVLDRRGNRKGGREVR